MRRVDPPPARLRSSPLPRVPPTRIQRTARGWRLTQHGTVLSEILAQPGPTHSVFDLLAAICTLHPAPRHLAILGFGGGGTLAALRALGLTATVHGVDLDPQGFHLLTSHPGPSWEQPLRWSQADAVDWLRRSRRRFDIILDDLSAGIGGEVEKPEATWSLLPPLIRARLQPGGLAVLNLLPHPQLGWHRALGHIREPFDHAIRVDPTDFQNRVVVAGDQELAPRTIGIQLRHTLRLLGSRLARRFAVRSMPDALTPPIRPTITPRVIPDSAREPAPPRVRPGQPPRPRPGPRPQPRRNLGTIDPSAPPAVPGTR